MQPLLQYLNRYIRLSEGEQNLVLAKFKPRGYRKGQYIVQAGDVCKYQTYILSGAARTFYLDKNGTEHIISFGIEQWWVGDVCSFATQTPADFDVQCLENSQVLQISHHNLQQLYQEVPQMERFFRLIIQKAYGNAQKRIVRNHSLDAKTRYLLFLEEYPQLAERVPQYMIASYLGITKEFLSHIRRKLSS